MFFIMNNLSFIEFYMVIQECMTESNQRKARLVNTERANFNVRRRIDEKRNEAHKLNHTMIVKIMMPLRRSDGRLPQ